MTHQHEANLINDGYCHLKVQLSAQELAKINLEFSALNQQANAILQDISQQKLSYADYYQQGRAAFITVPEAEHPTQTCRFEYIQATSEVIRDQLIPLCAQQIYHHTAQKVVLFKDKCNLKSPGGGAFSPHQDIPAYIDFGPKIHITAAVFLDDATAENGALEMANNYMSIEGEGVEFIDTPLGSYPMLATYQGGSNNGRIVKHLEDQLQWQPVYAQAGDIVLFNSYIPHRSAVNLSNATRRAFFFTFNLQADGELYETYYQSKRADFGNLRFHVATPTSHNDSKK
jgi:ectoine hydroxylase-related dioxygenase (phytanoyl-CoA dioxygenase family)